MLLSDSFLGMVHYVNSKLGSSLQNGNKYNGSPEIEYAAVGPTTSFASSFISETTPPHFFQVQLQHVSLSLGINSYHINIIHASSIIPKYLKM